jgi:hypothetical protein
LAVDLLMAVGMHQHAVLDRGLPVAGGHRTSLRAEDGQIPKENGSFCPGEGESDWRRRSDPALPPWPKTPLAAPRRNRRISGDFEAIRRLAEI